MKYKRTDKLIDSKKYPEEKTKFEEDIESIGFWNIKVTEFAREYGVPRPTVEKWKLDYVNKFGIPKVKEFSKEININSQAILKESTRMVMNAKTIKEKAVAIGAFTSVMKSYSEFLQNFKFMDKVSDPIELGLHPEVLEMIKHTWVKKKK